VRYRIDADNLKAYQCHCSLCRKQSGTASNLGALVRAEKFAWTDGEKNISSWIKDSGFTSDFCSRCGSPVPNPLPQMNCYWIPVGTLEDAGTITIIAHICAASKAGWDEITGPATAYEHFPDATEFGRFIN
jgi:hypothetical protein